MEMNNTYKLINNVPSVDDFMNLRAAAGLNRRSRLAVERGLPNTLFGVTAYHKGRVVAMGRVIGDGGCNYEIVDMAVLPEYQGNRLGTRIMEKLMAYINENAVPTAYVCLIADVSGFYERFGFRPVEPGSEGMYFRVGQVSNPE